MNKASCLSLLSNAVLVWNTARMGEIVARLRADGETVSDEDLARIYPLAYAHVM
jgi:TnpA family transposase